MARKKKKPTQKRHIDMPAMSISPATPAEKARSRATAVVAARTAKPKPKRHASVRRRKRN